MDLRPHITGNEQLDKAKALAARGLLSYQPFIFADDLQTGVGYEFCSSQEGVGLLYWPTVSPELAASPGIRRLLLAEEFRDEFVRANARLRRTYDDFVDEICRRVGDLSETTFLDVGCNSGYFPLSFALRGARRCVGYDRENYTDVFALLNDVLGTNAEFVHQPYLHADGVIDGCPTLDVVVSMMTLCHLSDTLRHLAFLGSVARRAVFIWTLVADDSDYCVRFGEPNKYYHSDPFPKCFDNMVRPSVPLLRKSLELMGFTELHELSLCDEAVPQRFYGTRNLAILAMRPSVP